MSACPRCGVELNEVDHGLWFEDTPDRCSHTDARCAERLVARVAELESANRKYDEMTRGAIKQASDDAERASKLLRENEALQRSAAAARAKLALAREALEAIAKRPVGEEGSRFHSVVVQAQEALAALDATEER